MLRRLRPLRPVLSLLILAVVTAWFAAAAFHHHGAPSACDVCKVLHSTQATLPCHAPRLAQDLRAHRQDASPVEVLSSVRLPRPHGRAPPAA
jgi:hypothetical protein